MNVIHKFPLQVTDTQTVPMDPDAELLSVQYQRDQLVLWAMVNANNPPMARVFDIIGTGHYLSPTKKRRYIATVQNPATGLVWHIFERT